MTNPCWSFEILDVSFSHCSVTGIERYFHGLGQEWSLPESWHETGVFPWFFHADVKRQRYMSRFEVTDCWHQLSSRKVCRRPWDLRKNFGWNFWGNFGYIEAVGIACHQPGPPPLVSNVSGRLEGNSSRSPANYGGWGLIQLGTSTSCGKVEHIDFVQICWVQA